MVCRGRRCHQGPSYRRWAHSSFISQSYLSGDARNRSLNLKLHELMCLVVKHLQDPAQRSVEPPREEFRTLSELLNIKKGNRNVQSYTQHIFYLASCILTKPVSELVLIIIFIQGLSDDYVRDHLFCGKLRRFQKRSKMRSRKTLVWYRITVRWPPRPPRLPAVGGPEPMYLCSVEREKPRPFNDKILLRCHRCHKSGKLRFEYSIPLSNPRGKWLSTS